MAFDISNFTLDDIQGTLGTTLANTSLANVLNIHGDSANLRQFYNRFGVNSTYYADKSVFKLSKQYYFDVSFDFKPANSNVKTILANSLGSSSGAGLKYFIQSIEIPNFRSFRKEERHINELGANSPAGVVVIPTDNQMTFAFLSTELSIHEHVMYYWMKESTDQKWIYNERPFTKCNITVRMLDHKTSEEIYGYKFFGAYPHEVETMNPNQSAETPLTRTVLFNFDMMAVLPSKKITSSVLDDVFDKYIGNDLQSSIRRTSADLFDSL
jgi:hypothetical protein